jgi:hypothetical protein
LWKLVTARADPAHAVISELMSAGDIAKKSPWTGAFLFDETSAITI